MTAFGPPLREIQTAPTSAFTPRLIQEPSGEEPATCSSVEEGIQRYLSQLARRARVLTRDRDEAEELVQSTVERALRFKERFKVGTHARAWLMRVMHNLFISQRRRRAVELRVRELARFDPNCWASRTQAQTHLGLTRPVTLALDAMPSKLAEVVELVDLMDYSYQEAASAQQVPIGTIMSRLHRGRGQLANKLRERAPQVAA